MSKTKCNHCLAVILLLLLSLLFIGCGGNIKESGAPRLKSGELSWTKPLNYTDGSSMILGGYKIYYGTSTGQYLNYINVGPATMVAVSDLNLPPNQALYVSVTVYDDAGNESDYSNEVIIIT